MRTAAALVLAAATWIGVQVFVAPTAEAPSQPSSVSVEWRVSDAIARDLAEAGLARFDLSQLDEQDAEWLPQLLIGQGWTSTPGDGCECLYPPLSSI